MGFLDGEALSSTVGATEGINEGLALGFALGTREGVALGLTLGVLDGEGVSSGGIETVLLSSVTSALRARHRPCTVVPSLMMMEVNARMLPTIGTPAAIVAVVPTCQYT